MPVNVTKIISPFVVVVVFMGLICLEGAMKSVQAQTVKIGVLAPLTGPASADGEDYVRAVEWAIEDSNKSGGVAGCDFKIKVADVKDMSAANVTSAVERLLADKDVHFILTGYASLSNFEIDLMKEAGMPFMIAGPASATEAIISKSPEDYWCCWSFTASFKGYETRLLPMLEELAAKGKITLKNKKVAIISSDNPYSKTISEGMKKVFKDGGWKVTVDELVPYGEINDWRTSLAKVRQNPPDPGGQYRLSARQFSTVPQPVPGGSHRQPGIPSVCPFRTRIFKIDRQKIGRCFI